MTSTATERLAPRVLARPEHTLSRQNISTAALKVLYRLYRSGYTAYLVGGGVRDLMLGNAPKDFDIGTNARPQEVRRLFRNSRIIGRRFRLVHVFFRDEIVEVATFRASPEPPEGPDEWEEAEQEAMEEEGNGAPRRPAVVDEAFGTPEEDARRRDFTVNALFYSIADFSIIDYVGGIDDLDARLIRTIGDPDERFKEDPVRMMRALEYSERLGFRVEDESLAAIDRCRDLIQQASPSRLTYELFEGLRSGSGAGILRAWVRSGVFKLAFPEIDVSHNTTGRVLSELDRRIAGGRSQPDATLVGALFLKPYYDVLGEMTDGGQRLDNADLLARIRQMLEPAAATMHLSNHTVHLLNHGLFSLSKMRRPPERGRQVLKLVRQEYFPVVWDLLTLAGEAGLASQEVVRGWARAVARVRRGQSVEGTRDGESRKPRQGRRRRSRGRRRRS